jgi:transcription antitermination factor NusG
MTRLFPGEQPASAGHELTKGVQPTDAALEWRLVRTATRREERAVEALVEAGFAVYLPRLIRWRRAPLGRRKRAPGPLFDGYLFVGFTERQAFAECEAVEAVHAVVRFSRHIPPTPLPFGIIAGILAKEEAGEFDRTRRNKADDPTPGTPVAITGGPFQGFPATFVQRRADERIEVLFSLFGRASPLVLAEAEVALPLRRRAPVGGVS